MTREYTTVLAPIFISTSMNQMKTPYPQHSFHLVPLIGSMSSHLAHIRFPANVSREIYGVLAKLLSIMSHN